MTAPLYAIGRFCSRHHYPTIAVWLVAAAVLVVVGQASGDKTNDNLTLPGTGSTVATELLEDNLPEQAYGSNPLAIESKAGPLTEPKYAKAIEETARRLQAPAIAFASALRGWRRRPCVEGSESELSSAPIPRDREHENGHR